MSDRLTAWVHWVKKNPISDDQLELANDIDALKRENEKLRAALAKIRDANPASTLAHPQNVWWRCHVQKWASDALDEESK